jgi:outer membrane immunogenic protein
MNDNFIVRFALASLMLAGATIGVAGSASAADLKAPPMRAAPYNWSGCYVGGFGGWATANNWASTDLGSVGTGGTFARYSGGAGQWNYSENSSFLGGGTLGCNWQPWLNSGLVLGIEGEGGYFSLSGSALQPNSVDVIGSSKMGNGYGLIAGRVGWAFFERVLLYGKAGVAFYNSSASVANSTASVGLPDTIAATGSKSQSPFTVGGGVEYAMWDHWTGKFEYMFVDGGSSYNACGVDSTFGQTFCWQQVPSSIHLVKIGLNYKF